MRYNFLLILIVAIVSLLSCGQYPCAKASLRYGLIGFTDAEADTIIMRRFTKNSLSLKDSFFFNENNPVRFRRTGDTLTMSAYTSDATLESDFDYQLFFPGAGKLYSITDIREEQSYGKDKGPFNPSGVACVNEITGYTLNGQFQNMQSPDRIYLKK